MTATLRGTDISILSRKEFHKALKKVKIDLTKPAEEEEKGFSPWPSLRLPTPGGGPLVYVSRFISP
jgi:hypothetical protein